MPQLFHFRERHMLGLRQTCVALLSTAVAPLTAPLLDLLAPPACAACDRRLERHAVFCDACSWSVEPPGSRPLVPETPRVLAFGQYGGALAVALKQLKYHGRSDLGRPLSALLRHASRQSCLKGHDVVVPVPLHPRQLAARGYNQAALLARGACQEVAAPLATHLLSRIRHTSAQALLDASARSNNVSGAFGASRAVAGRRVLLVDDVVTTGATLASCSEALRRAGAAHVDALVIARS